MKISDNKFIVIFILVIVAIPVIIVGVFVLPTIPEIRYGNHPEQSEQVEVVGKRIRVYSGSGKHSTYTAYTYIVAFKFPDGSVKELSIDRIVPKNSIDKTVSDKESYSSAYGSIQEGDTGVLIYKEIKNIEKKYKNEDMRPDSRLFISFEKDPDSDS